MKRWIAILVCFFFGFVDASEYQFSGIHYTASYLECDSQALCNLISLKEAMVNGALASGATVLGCSEHVFAPNGLTMVLLLSESHASIHTYPEHGACFVDLFTCGERCDYKEFERVLTSYLNPHTIKHEVLRR